MKQFTERHLLRRLGDDHLIGRKETSKLGQGLLWDIDIPAFGEELVVERDIGRSEVGSDKKEIRLSQGEGEGELATLKARL